MEEKNEYYWLLDKNMEKYLILRNAKPYILNLYKNLDNRTL